MLVSVIIPALNEADNIAKCIQAARRDYSQEEIEIVVCDGGSRDGTLERIPAGVRIVRAPRGRATQMNHGAAMASGEIFLFCHADSQLPVDWRESVIETLRDPRVVGGAFQTRYEPQRGLLLWLINHIRVPADWRVIHGD
ncbi:MAG: glycosyltransferase, partial [Anaerolineae bacterium]